jgi:enolase-phosphatase E1
MNPRAVLLDIEGTTTPITFVTETLFPYARQRGREFIVNHIADQEIHEALRQLQIDNRADRSDGAPPIEANSEQAIDSTIDYYLWLIDKDRKSTALKAIQGRIWHEGYERGDLQSTIFPDVVAALERWHRAGRIAAIYSSGSVLAQQELFRHTIHGDLTPFITAYFDTGVGSKKQASSYGKIAESLGTPANGILFVSDVSAELDAALVAGMMTALAVRPGNPSNQERKGHLLIRSFEELP